MSLDESKVMFSSTWDTDQIDPTTPVEVPVSSGDSLLYTFTDSSNPPVFDVQFRPTGNSAWFTVGQNSKTVNVFGGADIFNFNAYITGTSIRMNTSTAGTARVYVWEDKITY